MDKPVRKGKPNRVKSVPVHIKLSPELKQDFYDIADATGQTLTDLLVAMINEYKGRYLGSNNE